MQLKSPVAVGRRRRLILRLSIGLTARCGPICTDNFARGRQLTVLNCPSSSTTLKAQRSSSQGENAKLIDASERCFWQSPQLIVQKRRGLPLKLSLGYEQDSIQRKPIPQPDERPRSQPFKFLSYGEVGIATHPEALSGDPPAPRRRSHQGTSRLSPSRSNEKLATFNPRCNY
jgi:hypothetical protein